LNDFVPREKWKKRPSKTNKGEEGNQEKGKNPPTGEGTKQNKSKRNGNLGKKRKLRKDESLKRSKRVDPLKRNHEHSWRGPESQFI